MFVSVKFLFVQEVKIIFNHKKFKVMNNNVKGMLFTAVAVALGVVLSTYISNMMADKKIDKVKEEGGMAS